jgi:Aldehyde dehydrogenase family
MYGALSRAGQSAPTWRSADAAADRAERKRCIAKGIADGATLATGGGRPKDLDRGWYVEPTVFGNVDNHSVIAQEEIFGPVLSVIPAADEGDAVRIAPFLEVKFMVLEGRPEGYEKPRCEWLVRRLFSITLKV